ncbi:MAG TPA: hypothetical protein VG167_03755 [Verrucomicrobiae bacterium]|nr:hypothetical protein [Verrucomicrobiae bacterium]
MNIFASSASLRCWFAPLLLNRRTLMPAGALGLAGALLAGLGAPVKAASFALVNNWSDTQNPNGVWSYNQGNSPITVSQPLFWGQVAWSYLWFGDGAILRGSAPTGIDPFGTPVPPAHDWLPGDVMMHALSIPYGGDSTFLNVTWTSPADGIIDIAGRAWDGLIIPTRDVAWSLSVGGQTIASRSSVFGLYRTDAAAQFSNNLLPGASLSGIPVTQGEVVRFQVATDTYYGEFVGVQEDITLNPVPEPAVLSFVLAGLLVLAARQKRSQV